MPFGAEGAADRAARAFARASGEAVEIRNVPGNGGLLGVDAANALAEAGEPVWLLSTPTTHVLLPALRGERAAPHRAFTPLVLLGSAPNVLLVSPRLGIRSVPELVARARGERLAYASAGAGQTIHVCTALFCRRAGIGMTHVPYDRGSATAYDDLVAGRVHVFFDSLLGCRDRVARGDAVPLAISTGTRNAHLPDVPSLAECGFAGYGLDVWLGIFAANGAWDVSAALRDPSLSADLERLGLSSGPRAASELESVVAASEEPWRAALAAARE